MMVWLRLWVGLTGLAGFAAAIGAWWNPSSPIDTIYRNIAPSHLLASPMDEASSLLSLVSRLYATWLFLSTVVRCTFMLSSEFSLPLALVTLATYVVAWVHFAVEIFIYHTVPLKPGGQAPLLVASVSIGWMLWYLMAMRSTRKAEYRKKAKTKER